MFTKQFWGGFAVAFILAIGLAGWTVSKEDNDIMFPAKTLYVGKDFAMFSGSIVGAGRATQNGTITGECDRESGVCRLATLDQIGHQQVSQIYTESITIRRWDETMLVADSKSVNAPKCNYYEIKIYIPNQDISYTRYPLKKDGICENFEYKVFNWKIDDSYAYQRLTKAIEAD